ncbi:PIN domain protein [bacterium]|nr:PIN domain protein [bacterium]
MKIYLDNCCLNRPFDDQSQIRIKLETEAKLHIQDKIQQKQLELVWSYILDYENQFNPFEERKNAICKWKKRAVITVSETSDILSKAKSLQKRGLKSKDALHVSCAIGAKCDFFLTTDDLILKKLRDLDEIQVVSPLTFISLWEGIYDNGYRN